MITGVDMLLMFHLFPFFFHSVNSAGVSGLKDGSKSVSGISSGMAGIPICVIITGSSPSSSI